MYNNLNETIGSEEIKAEVNGVKNELTNLMEAVKRSPTSDAEKKNKLKNRNNMLKIVERTLEFNQLNQLGQGLKILTPNQVLSRLSIYLAQLNAGNNSERLKNEIRQLLYSFYR